MFGTLDIKTETSSQKYLLTQSHTRLGRDRENDICLDDPTVSRFHAEIISSADGSHIIDLGSANGTFVDGEELEPRKEHPLGDGSVIEIGPFLLRYGAPRGAGVALAEPASVVISTGAATLLVSTPAGTVAHPLEHSPMTLGRDPANDIVVDLGVVSRRHAMLERHDSSWEIVDLGSANGLEMAGRRVERVLLSDGDTLAIGPQVQLKFQQSRVPGAESIGEPIETEFDLPKDAPLVLGRSSQADVVLSHPQVSRAHAQITRRGTELVVQDLGSSSGTYVNGRPIQEQALSEGDIVRVGTSRLMLVQGRLRVLNEEGNLRIDAFHLSRQVGKGLRILQDVSLSILPREFVAIVGGSGSGKTTLLNALCGFQPATGGRVLLNGVDLYRSFGAYRYDMGYVPQDDIIHRDLLVLRALNYAAELRMPRDTTPSERAHRVQQVLRQLDIENCWDRWVRQLSGGQRKRVSMGVELLTRPSLFFLDEATSGLDPGTESQMMRLLRRLADDGRTVILVTHATKNVMMCDKVLFLARGGHLAFFGGPEEALRYFEVSDFDEIYTRLEEGEPQEWGRRFRSSEAYRKNVEARLSAIRPAEPALGGEAPARAPASAAAQARRISGLRQFLVLCKRQLDTMWGDKKTAALLLALAPFLGALDFLIWKRDMFHAQGGNPGQAVMMFFITAIITIMVGTIASVREIVKEDAVYKRERMVGLRVLPYVCSKAAIGFLFAFYSALMLFAFMMAAVDFSHLGAIDRLAILVPMVLGTFAGVMWGLLISALAPTEDRAMLLVLVVLVPQFVFSGGVIPMKTIGPIGTVLGWLMSARWELGAMVTSAKVEGGAGALTLPGLGGLPGGGIGSSLQDQYGDIFEGAKVNLQKALELDDTDALSHWALGGVFYDQGEYEAALPELERAVALRPENAGMLAWLGACYMALERWEEARAALEKAVELDPDREDARELLDELTAQGR